MRLETIGLRRGAMGVDGLEGLKVADASVMPYVTNGNIYPPQ
jgi:choline dehydrogenase